MYHYNKGQFIFSGVFLGCYFEVVMGHSAFALQNVSFETWWF